MGKVDCLRTRVEPFAALFYALSIGYLQRIFISDRRDSTPFRLPNIWLSQPLPALSAVYCTTCPSKARFLSWVDVSLPHFLPSRPGRGGVNSTQLLIQPHEYKSPLREELIRLNSLAPWIVYKSHLREELIRLNSSAPWIVYKSHLR